MNVHVQPTDGNRITAQIIAPRGVETQVTTESNYKLDHSATPWLAPLLVAGMRKGWNIGFSDPVDSFALRGAVAAQNILVDWYPKRFRQISVSAEPTQVVSGAKGVGCFFSGGVDSFYSAITQSDRISHLIFVHGFDIAVDDEDLALRALSGAREAAAELGKPLIEIKTTLRPAFGNRLPLEWGYDFHGAALAHVGLALSQHLNTVIIPSSYSRRQLHPWGSHPELDPLWSSNGVAFEHHELDVDRYGKIRFIGGNETAMKHLRVCWQNPNGSFNCGRCAKCLRTKIGLILAGAESSKLPGAIDLGAVRRMKMEGWDRRQFRDGIAALEQSGTLDVHFHRAMKRAIRRSYRSQAMSYSVNARPVQMLVRGVLALKPQR